MISVIIAAHGNLADELIKTAEMIVGKQTDIWSISVTCEQGLDTVQQTLESIVRKIPGNMEILVLTDMPGGTPCNVACLVASQERIGIVSGVNLPMLISALNWRGGLALKDLIPLVCTEAKECIFDVKERLQRIYHKN